MNVTPIVVNDLSQIDAQVKAALAKAGIDANQFGNIGAQIEAAVKQYGASGVVPVAVETPVNTDTAAVLAKLNEVVSLVQSLVSPPTSPAPTVDVVEPEGPSFGALLDTHEDEEIGWTGTYNVKGAKSIKATKTGDSTITLKFVSENGEQGGDEFYGSDDLDVDGAEITVDKDGVLTLFVPHKESMDVGTEYEVYGFVSAADDFGVEVEEDEPSEDDWCEECGEYHAS